MHSSRYKHFQIYNNILCENLSLIDRNLIGIKPLEIVATFLSYYNGTIRIKKIMEHKIPQL